MYAYVAAGFGLACLALRSDYSDWVRRKRREPFAMHFSHGDPVFDAYNKHIEDAGLRLSTFYQSLVIQSDRTYMYGVPAATTVRFSEPADAELYFKVSGLPKTELADAIAKALHDDIEHPRLFKSKCVNVRTCDEIYYHADKNTATFYTTSMGVYTSTAFWARASLKEAVHAIGWAIDNRFDFGANDLIMRAGVSAIIKPEPTGRDLPDYMSEADCREAVFPTVYAFTTNVTFEVVPKSRTLYREYLEDCLRAVAGWLQW